MKAAEKKIEKAIRFEEVPAYLRYLADAIENKSDKLPTELNDLPQPIEKLQIKSKSRGAVWEFKIKIKAAPPEDAVERTPAASGPSQAVASAVSETQPKYKHLKKRMKASFKAIGESLAADKFPEPEVMTAFLADSDRMMTFSGAKYGEEYYPAYREACRRLEQAFGSGDAEALQAGYTALDALKKDCHKVYK